MPASYTSSNLPILAGIHPAELRRKGATLSLARCAMEPRHLGGNARHLKPRHLFVPTVQQLTSSTDGNNRGVLDGSSMECGNG